MAQFIPYMHLSRFGNTEVDGIEYGETYIFPKIDGTNSSIWLVEGLTLGFGSRTRTLSLEKDNAGFMRWAVDQPQFYDFFRKYPHLRLYGEWLVPHTFKQYRDDAWRKFYVFDVYNNDTSQYVHYIDYKPMLEAFDIEYIPPLAVIKNGKYDTFLKYLNENKYLCPDSCNNPGEGITIKNYGYYNKYGKQVWAKIVSQEFKEEHYKAMGAPEVNGKTLNEERIVEKTVSKHLIDKTVAKIATDLGGWSSKYIPRLLETVYHDVISEELYDALKEIKSGSIDFKLLKALIINKIKQERGDLF